MPLENLADTESLFDDLATGVSVYLGSGNTVAAVFDQLFDDDLEVNGQRSALRVTRASADLVAIGATVTITDSYTDPATETDYIVRAKEIGQRTALLVLEAA
jgi:hypothetical protein